MSLRAINQNLLPVLLALLRERSVTRAARAVGLSQPACSKALIQLRTILGDELLVRAGRNLVLTRRGEELIAPVAAICEGLEQLWHSPSFDAATSKRQFVIAGTDYCAMLMVPALASTLIEQAPDVRMRFVELVPQQIIEERTDIDFALAPTALLPRQLIDAGGVMPLFVDEFVAVVARDHPRFRSKASLAKDLAATAGIAFGNDNPLLPPEIRGTELIGVPGGKTLAVVQHLLSAPVLALMTGMIAVVPRRLLNLIGPTVALRIVPGVAPQQQVTIVLAWHKRHENEADHRWFRSLVAEQMQDAGFR